MNNRVIIFDTTLRDGEQVPGCQLNTIEKIEVAKQLESLGVDVIEAGFPISSPGDFKSIVEVSQAVANPIICALTRAVKEDIDSAVAALKKAKRKRIHTGIGASDIHIENKFGSTRDQVLEQAIWAVKYAKKYVEDIEFYAEDAGRADLKFLALMVEKVIAAGATVVNIPDTTGYCLPDEFGKIIRFLFEEVKNIHQATISVHCHNDLGLATANSITALTQGARQVEVTVNGIGERAGNTALEEIVMTLKTHRDLDLYTQINTKKITQTSRLVSRLMQMPVQANKAIVGRNAFAHSSGIHQHGVLKHRNNYEIIDPQDVGIDQTSIILTARSGRAALTHRLNVLGHNNLSKTKIDQIYQKFLKLADKKKEINDNDLQLLMGQKITNNQIELVFLEVTCGTPLKPTARVMLRVPQKDKQIIEKTTIATGNGPVNAALKAIDKIIGIKVRLDEYLVQANTGNHDDLGKVHLRISYKDHDYYGFGSDTDIVTASVKAYLEALNKVIKKYEN